MREKCIPPEWNLRRKVSQISVPHSVAEVELEGLTGNYAKDAGMANRAAGLEATPEGYVWHHVEDGRTMQLVPQDIHGAARHTGGSAVIRNGGF